MTVEIYEHHVLRLEVEDGDEIHVRWFGKSTARDPGEFILPILSRLLERSAAEDKPLVLDFQQIEYLNSSTITPIIRLLEQAKKSSQRVMVLYDEKLKWQSLSFSALEVFRTSDGRIQVRGG